MSRILQISGVLYPENSQTNLRFPFSLCKGVRAIRICFSYAPKMLSDAALTDALIEEGYAREFISKVQSMRKDTGFDVTDHIAVTCQCGEKLAAALDKARDMVLAGVLADSLTLTDTAGGEAVKEWDINGESAVIGVKRV